MKVDDCWFVGSVLLADDYVLNILKELHIAENYAIFAASAGGNQHIVGN